MSDAKDLRPSNRERTPYEEALAQAYAEGRLDEATYEQRMEQVAAATRVSHLEEAVRDVPFEPAATGIPAPRGRSRRAFLGLVALVGVAGGSYWATTRIPDPAPPAENPAPTPTPTPTPSGSPEPVVVATSMMQVPVGTAESFPILVGHLAELGITAVERIQMFNNTFVTVKGLRGSEPVRVIFRTDWAPTVEVVERSDATRRAPSDFADLDAADIIERSGDFIVLGDEPSVDVRWLAGQAGQWVITVRGVSTQVYWDFTGQQQLQI